MTESDTKKRAMIEALKSSLGIVSTACNTVDISRQTHYRWLSEDTGYKEQVEDISEMAIDFVESKLHEKIKGVEMGKVVDGAVVTYELAPSDTAIIFFLKTKAKKRGYIEKTEIDQKTEHSGSVAFTGINIIKPNEPSSSEEVHP
jgi:hypothetical protein